MFGKNKKVSPADFRSLADNELKLTSGFLTLQGEGIFQNQLAYFTRFTGCNLTCEFCLIPSTLILMGDGSKKRIDQIEFGDMVMSYNNDKFEPKPVTKIYKSVAEKIIKIETSSDKKLYITPNHPVLTSNRGFINAGELIPGDKLIDYSVIDHATYLNLLNSNEKYDIKKFEYGTSNNITVASVLDVLEDEISEIYASEKIKNVVYNFEVEDNHTYVANGIVVHNCDTFFDHGDIYTFEKIEEMIEKSIDEFCEKNNNLENRERMRENLLVVVTGGEPMLQKNITNYLNFLHSKGFRTQIESNGTLFRDIPNGTTLIVSPKIVNQTYSTLDPRVFDRANALKFVVSADPNDKYHVVPDYAKEFSKTGKPVFVSPMNTYNKEPTKVGNNANIEQRSEVDERISFWTPGLLNLDQNQKNHEYAAFLAMKYNFRLNLQTHLYASLP